MEVVLGESTTLLHACVGVAGLARTELQLALVGALAVDVVDDAHRTVLALLHHRSALGGVCQAVESVLEPCIAGPVVIVGGSTQRIEAGTVALCEHLLGTVGEGADAAAGIVEAHFEAIAADGDALLVLLHAGCLVACCCLGDVLLGCGSLEVLHVNLLCHLHETLLAPRHVLLETELYSGERVGLHAAAAGEGDGHRVTCGQSAHTLQLAAGYHAAVYLGAVSDVIVEGSEVVLVEDDQ